MASKRKGREPLIPHKEPSLPKENGNFISGIARFLVPRD